MVWKAVNELLKKKVMPWNFKAIKSEGICSWTQVKLEFQLYNYHCIHAIMVCKPKIHLHHSNTPSPLQQQVLHK